MKFSEWKVLKEEGLAIQPSMPTTNTVVGNAGGETQIERPEITALIKLIGTKTGDPKLVQAARPMINLIASRGWLPLLQRILMAGGGITTSTFGREQQKINNQFA